jgi:hypothetical protein
MTFPIFGIKSTRRIVSLAAGSKERPRNIQTCPGTNLSSVEGVTSGHGFDWVKAPIVCISKKHAESTLSFKPDMS